MYHGFRDMVPARNRYMILDSYAGFQKDITTVLMLQKSKENAMHRNTPADNRLEIIIPVWMVDTPLACLLIGCCMTCEERRQLLRSLAISVDRLYLPF